MLDFLSRKNKKSDHSRKVAEDSQVDLEADDIVDPFEDEISLVEDEISLVIASEEDSPESEIEDLMGSIKQQSIEISCEFAAFANWSAQIETLTARAATLQPKMKGLVEKCRVQGSELQELHRLKDASDRQIAELKVEVDYYRPLAARLEDEARIAREKYGQAQVLLTSLEDQHSQSQANANELMHKLSSAESRAARLNEENTSLKQKALEHNTVIQSLMREAAGLKSAVSIAEGEVESQKIDLASLAEKLAIEKETASQAASTISAMQMREARLEKEYKTQITDLEELQQELIQKVAHRDKMLYEAELKIAAVNAKVEFLTQMNQRFREDLRGHIDHSNMLEVSNRQLLEAMSHRRTNEDELDLEHKAAKQNKPKLRAVQVAE